MKKYEKPEVEMTSFSVSDIITTSAVDVFEPETVVEVAGVEIEAKDFGTQAFSIFEVE
ncbi:MAG: hypothetical protein J6D15_03745 [Clostridia bacterium]|nr:hypothetical protein [Clostridia bacterium]